MKKVLAILVVVAIVTAFALVPSTSATDTEGKICDRLDFLNKDNIKPEVKEGKPVQFWEPLAGPEAYRYFRADSSEWQRLIGGMAKAFYNLEPWGAAGGLWEGGATPSKEDIAAVRVEIMTDWENQNLIGALSEDLYFSTKVVGPLNEQFGRTGYWEDAPDLNENNVPDIYETQASFEAFWTQEFITNEAFEACGESAPW